MIRKFVALFALVLTLGLAAGPVAAQDFDPNEFEEAGVVNILARQYQADPEAEVQSNSLTLMVVGIELDDADRVDDATFDPLVCAFTGGFVSDATGVTETQSCEDLEAAGFTVVGVEDIGDRALEITGDTAVPLNVLALQSDNFVFIIIDIGNPTSGDLDALGTFLADAEPSDAEVMLSEDGTSTGGFFDMLPQEGDPVIEGFVAAGDISLTEAPATGTPESTPGN